MAAPYDMNESDIKRFESKFVKSEGCWIWNGGGCSGYGTMRPHGNAHVSTLAHRISYELYIGPIPEGKEIDHLCRNRKCVNPIHMEPVTKIENVMRGMSFAAQNARKTHCKNGHLFDSVRSRGKGNVLIELANHVMQPIKGRENNVFGSTPPSQHALDERANPAAEGSCCFGNHDTEADAEAVSHQPGTDMENRRKTEMKYKPSEATLLLWDQLLELHSNGYLDNIGSESTFYPNRKWKFDFSAENSKTRIAIEIEGGVWVKGGGGHNRGQAFIDDMEKYNHAALLGWRVLRFTPSQVLKGEAIAFIRRVLDS